jgi:ADP-ribose pyrophosphatase YjhB (NUDIX family)
MISSIFKLALDHIKQKYVHVGIPVIIQNSKKEILLGKRSKNVFTYPNTWGLPGGLSDYGEKLEEGAKREVKEEMGIEIKIIRKSKNTYENLPNKECKFHSVDIPFYGKIIKGIPNAKDETKEIRWFKPSEIKNMKLVYSHKTILIKEGLI